MTKSTQTKDSILAIMPDFKSNEPGKIKIVGMGPTREIVRRQAETNVAEAYGPFWSTAFRSVVIGNRWEVTIKFKSLTPDAITLAIKEFRRGQKTAKVNV